MIAQSPSGRKSVSPSAKPSPQGPLGGVLGRFLGKVFTHFSKPRKKFLADMLYGIQASEDALAETRQGPGVRELCDRGRTQTCLHAVREMVPQDHRPGTRANRERAARVPPGIQGTVRSRPLLKSVECELRSAKLLKFCGAGMRPRTPDRHPLRGRPVGRGI